jgi:hypothetical protein
MFATTKTKVIALVAVGVVALGGATYATTALAVGGATAAPATVVATQTAADPQLRASILEMLKDRMGLTGANAETFADQMIARMQGSDPDFDFQAMVNWCNQYTGANTNGWGMMGGGTIPDGGSSDPSGATPQNGGSGSAPRGMMGGSMMGNSGLR